MAESQQVDEGDRLFLIAESLASDFSLFAERDTKSIEAHVQGLLSGEQIATALQELALCDTDSYCERCVAPAEDPGRASAKDVLRELGGQLKSEDEDGPFYAALLTLPFAAGDRDVGFITQNRAVRNGVWGPEHHLAAARQAEAWCRRNIPIVTLMDTPGADAEEAANSANQAHTISRLIAKMANLDVPTVGVVLGLGYSGGAIPLATTNLVLSVRDGVFNTIQPKGLANIARKYDLSWQECAKLVGVSAYELYQQGNIDGIVDYSPADGEQNVDRLRAAIITGIENIEESTKTFVADNPYLLDHYRRSLSRYLSLAEELGQRAPLDFSFKRRTTTEFITVFGIAYRYLRYLGMRKRIKSTTVQQYGRLAEVEVPRGELAGRADEDRRRAFVSWLQDPEKLIYDDTLAKAWRSFLDKRKVADDERGLIAQLIFGEPKKEYEQARATLVAAVTTYLYNRWKVEAEGNFTALIERLRTPEVTRLLLRSEDITDPRGFLEQLAGDDAPLAKYLREHLGSAGRKLLAQTVFTDRSESYLREHIAAELNVLLMSRNVAADLAQEGAEENPALAEARTAGPGTAAALSGSRALLAEAWPSLIDLAPHDEELAPNDVTILDVLLEPDLREDFSNACAEILIFDDLYNQIVGNLARIAAEADATRQISFESMGVLLDQCLRMAATSLARSLDLSPDMDPHQMVEALRAKLLAWLGQLKAHGQPREFLKAVEEWKKAAFPRVSDTLFVVVTEVFEKLIPSYAQALEDAKRYDGHINPKNIGRRKDFWNRLTMAYHDLQIQQLLDDVKSWRLSSPQALIERYFESFEELNPDLISADPVSFPGFRVSIEQALAGDVTPCGVITGTGRLRGQDGTSTDCGVMISNVDFQAGAFDMASAEKFCLLLVECARRRVPVICFISSGGMQTKEGAGALYSMAVVNDRITRFIRDVDLPIVVFGFGDCTGGAQASFVTHPLVHNYYFSGTNMPFAGQIVVPANLPSRATLSNYLSTVPGAMHGLVRNPFYPELDEKLREIDGAIPSARQDVEDVLDRVIAGMPETAPAAPADDLRAPDPTTLIRPVKRTLIHARGCTAAKLIRVAHQLDIDIVLVQSDPDMDSVSVDMLDDGDQVICIGGNTSDESYLNGLSVVRVAEHEQADSLHPGIGFLSETSQFAALCRAHGINFIGPPVDSMEAMGNKSNAIATARRLNVPVVPGSHGILTDIDRAADVADEIGYPVLIKAVHGGGGKGIQVVESPSQFHDLFRRVTVEARSAFGNGDVYLEKFVTSLRHIEVQLLRDTHGNTLVLGLRDCSVQRNKQKIIEESGSTMLPEDLEAQVYEHTAAIADDVGYVGAGTVEYIYDVANRAVYFMEMNTRLQVEHPVTEKVSGINIVAEQFRIAGGESIAQLEPGRDGYSIEVRVNAEKLVRGADGEVLVRPDPGTVTRCEFPVADDIDVISAIAAGKTISPFYDSLVAQIIVHGTDREQAARRLAEYLSDVHIEGICTNLPLLRRILVDETFLAGEYDTSYLEHFLPSIDLDALIEEIEEAATLGSGALDASALKIEGSDELKVLSPTSGIFYLTPSPSDPEYVAVGDEVSADHTLCQLEAMKLFTPLKLSSFNGGDVDLYPSDQRYEVTRINIANGQQVNAGDLLFVVKPVQVMETEEAA